MGDILFLAHRIPFPADRGDKIRSHNILKHLVSRAPVHVATFADDERDLSHVEALAALSRTYKVERRAKPMAIAGMQAMLSNEPVSITAFASRGLRDYVARTLAEHDISTIFAFSGQMAQYVPADFPGRFIMDFVDMDSAKFASYAAAAAFPRAALYRREARLLSAFERQVAARADASVFVSRAEVRTFVSGLNGGAANVLALRNGIDVAFYNPDAVIAEPSLAGRPGPTIVFTGQMDYLPNRDAVIHFSQVILPRIRANIPNAGFAIVGRNPPADVLALHGKGGVIVTGEVPDVRGWLKAASVAVAPLRIARGVQNKVLEAMAMARPVVASEPAATGIDADNGRQFLIARDDRDFAGHIENLLSDPSRAEQIGREARHLVETRMSWPAALQPLDDLLGAGPAAAARRVA